MAHESYGIDFGTSTILLCRDNAGVPEVVSLSKEAGKSFLPSSFLQTGGTWVFAPEQAATGSTQSVKARITALDNPSEAELKDFLPALISVFEHLATNSPASANLKGAEVRIATPVLWNKAQRNLLIAAARAAGYRRPTLSSVIEEPVAAGAEWLRSNPDVNPGSQVLIFDCGGGTTDIAVLEAVHTDNEVTVVVTATKAVPLGGDFSDLLIVNWLLENHLPKREDTRALLSAVRNSVQNWKAYPSVGDELNPLFETIRRIAREVKETVSRGITTPIPFLAPFGDFPAVAISPEQLTHIMKPLWNLLANFAEATVREANWRTRKSSNPQALEIRRRLNSTERKCLASADGKRVCKSPEACGFPSAATAVDSIPSVEGARMQDRVSALSQVTNVFLVGGMVNIPSLVTTLDETFASSDIRVAGSPQETVVSGLAPRPPFAAFTVSNPGLDIVLVDQDDLDYELYSMFTPLYNSWEMFAGNDYAGIRNEVQLPKEIEGEGRLEFRLPDGQRVKVHMQPLCKENDHSIQLGGLNKILVKIYANGNLFVKDSFGRDWHGQIPFWPTGTTGKAPRQVTIKESKRPEIGNYYRYWEN